MHDHYFYWSVFHWKLHQEKIGVGVRLYQTQDEGILIAKGDLLPNNFLLDECKTFLKDV
jgi:hypothetical protein